MHNIKNSKCKDNGGGTRMKTLASFAAALFVSSTLMLSGQQPAEEKEKTEEDRIMKIVEEKLSQMTLEEKISLCHGNSTFYINAIPRIALHD